MGRLGVVVIAMALFLLVGQAGAEAQTITATHTYTLGDNDSRNDARQLCFLEAKRKVLEKAGVYIQSQAEVENLKLTKDKISSYSGALLSVEIVKEEFGASNGQNVLTLVVKAEVDIADVRKRLEAIAGDKRLQERMDDQQQQIQQLEEQIVQLSARAAPPMEEIEPLTPSPLGTTVEVTFVPEQMAGIRHGCVLLYNILGFDHLYRKGIPFGIRGNINYFVNKDRSQSALGLKIAVFNNPDKPDPPFFAYIQTAHGTTAKSPFNQFDSPDNPGVRFFVFGMDENTGNVLKDLLFGEPATIGFNRTKGGPDFLLPLDLRVAKTRLAEGGAIHQRSHKTVLDFGLCVEDLLEQQLNLPKAKKPRKN